MKSIVVIGNGPSMKKEHLQLIQDTETPSIGMNAIYRLLKTKGWFPRYYLCFDASVTGSHKKEFLNLIADDNNGIEKFCFYKVNFKDFEPNDRVILKEHPPNFKGQKFNYVTTGTCAVRFAIELGYDTIIITGVDCNYKEKVAERITLPNTRATYKLTETPKRNPNYFFDEYQVEGDIYNTPNAPYHRLAWQELAQQISSYRVRCVQTSPIFNIQGFENLDFNKAMEKYVKK